MKFLHTSVFLPFTKFHNWSAVIRFVILLLSFDWVNWADDKQSKARNSDGKYRQMALVRFWYIHLRFCVRLGTVLTMQNNVRWPWPFSYINLSSSSEWATWRLFVIYLLSAAMHISWQSLWNYLGSWSWKFVNFVVLRVDFINVLKTSKIQTWRQSFFVDRFVKHVTDHFILKLKSIHTYPRNRR